MNRLLVAAAVLLGCHEDDREVVIDAAPHGIDGKVEHDAAPHEIDGKVVRDAAPDPDGAADMAAEAPLDASVDAAADAAADVYIDLSSDAPADAASEMAVDAATDAGEDGGTPPACAALGGFCTDVRWEICPAGYEPAAGDGNQDCAGGAWCCVPAPASECSDSSPGNCLEGSACPGCWAPTPGTPACEPGRLCCIYICD